MYLGRFQLGVWLDVYLQCTNASRTPKMPDAVPKIKIRFAGTGNVEYTSLMPIVDKSINIGLFCSRVFLGQGFSVGMHSVEMTYSVAGSPFVERRVFEISPAGDPKGQVLSSYYLHEPQADFVVYQVESGLILTGKNPMVN
jgi:hypothetical protein